MSEPKQPPLAERSRLKGQEQLGKGPRWHPRQPAANPGDRHPELVFKGLAQPSGYTEPLLHAWRLKVKAAAQVAVAVAVAAVAEAPAA